MFAGKSVRKLNGCLGMSLSNCATIVFGPNGFDRDAWLEQIDRHPQLATGSPRRGINPFTGEEVIFRTPPTVASVTDGARQIGTVGPAEDGSAALNVFALSEMSDKVLAVAETVAEALGGRLAPSA